MIVQWTKAAGATSSHRQALIRSNEIETAVRERVSAGMFGGEILLSGPSCVRSLLPCVCVCCRRDCLQHREGKVMMLSSSPSSVLIMR